MLRRARVTVAYDGSGFHGFAKHEGTRTVMGELSATSERSVRIPLQRSGAGRTDAGGHGRGQEVRGDDPAGCR